MIGIIIELSKIISCDEGLFKMTYYSSIPCLTFFNVETNIIICMYKIHIRWI